MRTTHLYIITAMLLAAGCGSDAAAAERPPNILLAIADDAGHMGRSVAWVDTPSLDQVADAGHTLPQRLHTKRKMCALARHRS